MTSSQCPVCGQNRMCRVIEVRSVPVFCNVLLDTQSAARNVVKGDITLEHCENCGHLFNSSFEPELVEYDLVYENSLHFSPRFQSFASALAEELIQRYGLYDKHIVEIGSGRGDFLRLLCQLGQNHGFGFDPSFEASGDSDLAEQITFIRDSYSERYADVPSDFICSRHTLEHVDDCAAFVQLVRRALGQQSGVPVYFEVPNALYTVRDLGIWDLIYEHRSYFGAASLAYVFAHNGFDVCHVTERYAGQFLSIETLPRPVDGADDECADRTGLSHPNDVAAHLDDFRREYREKVARMRQVLDGIRSRAQQCVLWGAGSKGVTFLNVLGVGDEVGCVVDINPRKQGKYVAGTGQEIVAPESLVEYRPDVVLVMNPIYLDEIAGMMDQMGLSPELVLV